MKKFIKKLICILSAIIFIFAFAEKTIGQEMWDVPSRSSTLVDALAGCNYVVVAEPTEKGLYSVNYYIRDQITMWLDNILASLKKTGVGGNDAPVDCYILYGCHMGREIRRNGTGYWTLKVEMKFDFNITEYDRTITCEVEDWGDNNLYYSLLSNIWSGKITRNSSKGPRSAKKMTKWTETALRAYWKENGFKEYEGIYENFSGNDTKYRLALKYINDKPYLIYLSGGNFDWQEGEVKATLESSSYGNGFKCNWKMLNKSTQSTFLTIVDGVMKARNDTYVKMYPTASEMEQITSENSKWSGTCFAIGGKYLATNYHVVEDAKNLVVSGIKGSYSKDYAVEVVVTDKINDLAILKITEPGFTGFGALKYGFKTQTTDIGTDVFVLGYPLITTMGEDIKLTTGVISSKSGFQGDVSQYQISAPVQPGNSGGPLFDGKGNVIGIVSAKHVGAENVGYAIKLSYLKNLAESANETITISSTNTISTLSLPEKIKAISSNVLIVKANFLDGKKSVAQSNSSVPKSSSSSASSGSVTPKSSGTNSSCTVDPNDVVKVNPNYDGSNISASVKIEKVIVTNEYTIVEMSYFLEGSWCSIDKEAYIYIQGRNYKLIKAEGIAYSPERTMVEDNRKVEFKLFFQPIPKGTKTFNIIENTHWNSWKFWNVELR